jgi:hypothetical protein
MDGQMRPRPAASVALSWLAMVGLDFVLHAGLLAPLFDWDSPFLLPAQEAFARIPLGYLALLVLAAALAWALPRCGIERGRAGALLAGGSGAVAWGAFLLGLWSISTADAGLLVGWWAGQTVELTLGGAVIGSILGGMRVSAVARRVAAVVGVGAVLTVILQTIGYATAPVLGS